MKKEFEDKQVGPEEGGGIGLLKGFQAWNLFSVNISHKVTNNCKHSSKSLIKQFAAAHKPLNSHVPTKTIPLYDTTPNRHAQAPKSCFCNALGKQSFDEEKHTRMERAGHNEITPNILERSPVGTHSHRINPAYLHSSDCLFTNTTFCWVWLEIHFAFPAQTSTRILLIFGEVFYCLHCAEVSSEVCYLELSHKTGKMVQLWLANCNEMCRLMENVLRGIDCHDQEFLFWQKSRCERISRRRADIGAVKTCFWRTLNAYFVSMH